MSATNTTSSIEETHRLLNAMYGNRWVGECDRGVDPGWTDFWINQSGDRCGSVRCGYWSEARGKGSVWPVLR